MMRVSRYSTLIAVVGLAGCGDRIVSSVNAPPTVTDVVVAPSNIVLFVGDKVSLTAMVVFASSGQADNRVRWTSANPAVASVDANGVVSSLAGGTTTITATSLADTLVSGSCHVTVATAFGNLSIAAINQDGNPINLSDVHGKIDVITNVDGGSTGISRVDLVLTRDAIDTVLASHVPDGSTSGAPTVLSFTTSGLSNGQYTLKARGMLPTGAIIVSASVQLTIRNP